MLRRNNGPEHGSQIGELEWQLLGAVLGLRCLGFAACTNMPYK